MSTSFTKLVKAGNLIREFNFRKFTAPADYIHVDVSDERGSRHIFKMQRNETDQWTIDNKNLPVWIYEAEGQLSEAIRNE